MNGYICKVAVKAVPRHGFKILKNTQKKRIKGGYFHLEKYNYLRLASM
jgi:hypothetical protein